MRILAFGDLHGDRKSLKRLLAKVTDDVDIIICVGDIGDWGENEEKIIEKFEKFEKPFLIIPGNHEDTSGLSRIAEQFEFVAFIHKGCYQIDKYLFFGYGGGGFANENKDFEKVAKRFAKTIKKNEIVISFTHGPPANTKLDYIPGFGHVGCNSIRKFILEVKPLLHLCGHIHQTFREKEVLGKTLIINPGPEGMKLDI